MLWRVLSFALAATLVTMSTPTVFAQNQPDAEPFRWPLQQWQALADGPPDETSSPEGEALMARVIRAGPRSSGAVALTFDDGYNAKACGRIATALRAKAATGTFFINGNYVRDDPDRWRRILRGMEVGNHTRSHHDLTRVPHPVVKKQVLENEWIHERVLGRPILKVLRPPYGAYGLRVRRIAAQLGYDRIAMWSVDTQDWKHSSSARDIVRRATGARPGSVILMHCARGETADALPGIIRHYHSRGIRLAGLSEVLGLGEVLEGAKATRDDAVPERYSQ